MWCPHLLQRDVDFLPVFEGPEAVIHFDLVVHLTLQPDEQEDTVSVLEGRDRPSRHAHAQP